MPSLLAPWFLFSVLETVTLVTVRQHLWDLASSAASHFDRTLLLLETTERRSCQSLGNREGIYIPQPEKFPWGLREQVAWGITADHSTASLQVDCLS